MPSAGTSVFDEMPDIRVVIDPGLEPGTCALVDVRTNEVLKVVDLEVGTDGEKQPMLEYSIDTDGIRFSEHVLAAFDRNIFKVVEREYGLKVERDVYRNDIVIRDAQRREWGMSMRAAAESKPEILLRLVGEESDAHPDFILAFARYLLKAKGY